MPIAEERRRFERLPIQLDARLKPGKLRSRQCTVMDYCSGGMLVRLEDGPTAAGDLETGSAVRLRATLTTPQGEQGIAIPSRVAWRQDDLVGIAFDRPSRSIVSRVQAHQRLSEAKRPIVVARAFPDGDRILRQLRHVSQETLPPVLRDILVKASQRLVEAADLALSDNERQQVYVDLASLERVRNEDPLTPAVLALAFDPGTGVTGDEPAYRDDEMTLVENEDFERWLEASKLANHLEQRFDTELSALGSRFAALRGDTSYISLAVPLEPQHFTGAIRTVAQQLELGATTRYVLYETALDILNSNLSGIYQALNDRLDQLGVPAPRFMPARPDSRQRGVAPAAQDADNGQVGADDTEADATPVSTGSGPPGASRPPLVAGDLALGLDPNVMQALLAQEKALRAAQAEDLVRVLADEGRTREDLAGWLDRISGSLLQEATHSETFFQDNDHPLRSIIDDLAHLQLFLPQGPGNDEPPALERTIAELIEPISRGSAGPEALRDIASEIGEIAGQESHRYQTNVARVVEAAEGRERVRQARLAVAEELNLRYAGRKVPTILSELLDVGWQATLELACLNQNPGDNAYADGLGLLDRVVAQLQGDAVGPPGETLHPHRLAEQVHRQLETVAFDPYRRSTAETRLRQALLDPGSDAAALVTMAPLGLDQSPAAEDSKPRDISRAGWRFALEQCASIRVGDHLCFMTDGGVDTDTRVAWIRSDGELLTLVDHQGLRVRDITLTEVAIGLHRATIRLDVIDGRPLSEKAVETMLGRMQHQLAFQSAHDSLTGLPNRRQFQASLQQLLSRDKGASKRGSLMWVDLDRFKLINDVHGYEAADDLLVAVARQLEQTPGAEVVGHLGGDRFALALPGVAPQQAMTWAETVCAALRILALQDRLQQRINATASVGVVALDQDRGTLDDLMQAAEHAVAAAKAGGGDRPYRYNAEDPDIQRNRESAQWLVQVDEALALGQLHLRCQPIVPLRDDAGANGHYEVLLGVSGSDRGRLELLPFIAAAERYQRMRNVDRWVLQAVTSWIDEHRACMDRLRGFAVNLSGQTASDTSFVDFVRAEFERHAIDPHWVSFEITETAAVTDITASAGIVHELKGLGCKVALDDFGSGQASYSYLKELPVDWLKIDGAFVRRIASSDEDFAVVKSINEIGHFLGKKTIAEYVADQRIMDRVRALGVDFAQGHLISPPRPIDELLAAFETPSG